LCAARDAVLDGPALFGAGAIFIGAHLQHAHGATAAGRDAKPRLSEAAAFDQPVVSGSIGDNPGHRDLAGRRRDSGRSQDRAARHVTVDADFAAVYILEGP